MTIALLVHGGAGPRPRAVRLPRIAAGLHAALAAGHAILEAGGTALDAAQAAVCVLEDEPVLNAGRGATPTRDGTVELDAAVMDGARRAVGAVAALTEVRNPVLAARAVLEDGRQVLLCGPGALAFARGHGLELRPPEPPGPAAERAADALPGTVGAVARDLRGHLAAATSTGGRSGQRAGRVGDSPLPGAGTWADDATAAISCTGDGEAFVRAMAAHEVDALMRHRDLPLEAACRIALGEVAAHGGTGGLIALARDGSFALPFTSEAMSRGWRIGDEPARIEL